MSRFRKRLSRRKRPVHPLSALGADTLVQKILGLRPSYLSYGEFTGSFLNALSKSPMFLNVFDRSCINIGQCLQGVYGSKIKITQCLCGSLRAYGSRPPRGWVAPI